VEHPARRRGSSACDMSESGRKSEQLSENFTLLHRPAEIGCRWARFILMPIYLDMRALSRFDSDRLGNLQSMAHIMLSF
jgi:hypothetical protein